MVSQCYKIKTMLLTQLFKPLIAELAGRFLYRALFFCSNRCGIETFYEKWSAQLPCKLPHESFIAVAFGGPELKIAMGNGKIDAGLFCQVCQHYRVDAAANGEQQPFIA